MIVVVESGDYDGCDHDADDVGSCVGIGIMLVEIRNDDRCDNDGGGDDGVDNDGVMVVILAIVVTIVVMMTVTMVDMTWW